MNCYILLDCNQYIRKTIAAFGSIEKIINYKDKFYCNQKNIEICTIKFSGKLKKDIKFCYALKTNNGRIHAIFASLKEAKSYRNYGDIIFNITQIPFCGDFVNQVEIV